MGIKLGGKITDALKKATKNPLAHMYAALDPGTNLTSAAAHLATEGVHNTKPRKKATGKKGIDWQKQRSWAVPLAAAVATWYVGGAGGLAAGGQLSAASTAATVTSQGMAASEAAKAGVKLEKRQRRETARLAELAYSERYMSGTRSMLSTRTSGGKATVG